MGNFDSALHTLISDATLSSSIPKEKRMYAIVFDLDQDTLSKTYHNPIYTNAYTDIKKALEPHGFVRQQGSVYFGDAAKVDAVTCGLAVMDIASKYSWFAPSGKDIRMLRIEDNNDLMPAVQKAAARK
jgi:virulence-associated protein VapD